MIPYGRQSIDSCDISAVDAALRSDWLTCGPKVEEFEAALCRATGAQFAVACSNGTAALHLACLALDIGENDLGVTSPITFLASANCIEFCGGKTDFVDIDPARLCLSPERLEEYCATVATPKVVVPVDFAGIPADLPAIWKSAKSHGFAVIEDAAHALGSAYAHEGATYRCGSCAHSDLAILSFHPVKTITTGEGGAITTNSDELARTLRLLRSHGMTKDPAKLTRNDGPWYYEMHELGFNYRITDIQCALGTSQLRRLGEFKKRRQEIVRRYNAAFQNDKRFMLPPWPGGADPCQHLYPLRFTAGSAARLQAYEALKAAGIGTQVHYVPVHLQPYYAGKYGYKAGKCPAAENYYSGCLSLPLYAGMSDADTEMVIKAMQQGIPVVGSRRSEVGEKPGTGKCR
jgi:UDP-4-amino-4,6-dideoxy-N-acetyl-beta-L-altrosamine transaminase